MEKSWPTPVSPTICGLPAALSAIARLPFLVPPTVGSKKTPTAQDAPGARPLPQAFSEPKSPVLVVALVIVRAPSPVLVSVTVWGRPEVPTYWFGKVRFGGDTVRIGPLPVPVKGTICGLPCALSVIVREAL